MKTILFIVSTMLAVQLQSGFAAPDKALFIKTVDKCKDQESITDESILEALKTKKLPDTSKGKCLLACLLEEFGVVVNNTYSKEGALKVAEKIFSEKPEKLEKAKAVIDECINEVANASGNRCELAFKVAECTKKHGDFDSY